MAPLKPSARAVDRDRRRGAVAFLCLAAAIAGAVAWARTERPAALAAATDTGSQAADSRPAERYALPITAPLDQGDTGLCWVFAALSMLETNYMSRHPGAHVEFSRAALQRDSIADRFHRLIRGEPGEPRDGGLAVEALALIREGGLIDRGDFHEVEDVRPLVSSLAGALAESSEPVGKAREVDEKLTAALGAKPGVTHLEGRPVTPAALASAALQGEAWTEFDLAHDGAEGWGPSNDPDARPDTRVRYVGLEALIALIHESLARGEAAVAGTADHAFLIYGADYDRAGRPVAYLVKDSLAPYLYRADADALHGELTDVTVALDGPAPDLASGRPGADAAASAGRL